MWPPGMQRVEHRTGIVALHRQLSRVVAVWHGVTVDGVHEPVYPVQTDTRLGVDPAVREVEHAAAADRGQLMPVTD